MTHKELGSEMAQRLDWTQAKVSETVDHVVRIMNERLSEDAQISIYNFGVFETKKKSERISVNPQSGKRYLVPPSIVATFKPATALKEQLKNIDDDGK